MQRWLEVQDDGNIRLDARARGMLARSVDNVALLGDLSLFEFSDIVSLMVHARLSGVLRVSTDSGDRALTFEDGELRGITSTRVGERLSEFMVREGLLEPAEMDELVARSEPGQRIGRIAVERGLVTEREVWNVMQEHFTSVLQAILLAPEGVFSFQQGAGDASVMVPGLSVEMLMMEGLRRIDELKVASPQSLRDELTRILASYNTAFRDVFATAAEAGAGDALARASQSAFASDAFQAAYFQGIEFTQAGEVPISAFLERFEEVARSVGGDADRLLHDVLAKAMLFLLFVTGEHLDPAVQRALHARAKAAIAPLYTGGHGPGS